jgi:hypothetical protein
VWWSDNVQDRKTTARDQEVETRTIKRRRKGKGWGGNYTPFSTPSNRYVDIYSLMIHTKCLLESMIHMHMVFLRETMHFSSSLTRWAAMTIRKVCHFNFKTKENALSLDREIERMTKAKQKNEPISGLLCCS